MSQSILLALARDSIKEVLEAKRIIDIDALIEQHPVLSQHVATFVTLSINSELRGCIGSLTPNSRLIDDIIHNAKAAAFEDPLFNPVSTSEYLHCSIEVSILTPAVKIEYSTIEELQRQINIGTDGVILNLDGKNATFLPQVWNELATFDAFFTALCSKASLAANCLKSRPKIYTYQVDSAKDTPVLK